MSAPFHVVLIHVLVVFYQQRGVSGDNQPDMQRQYVSMQEHNLTVGFSTLAQVACCPQVREKCCVRSSLKSLFVQVPFKFRCRVQVSGTSSDCVEQFACPVQASSSTSDGNMQFVYMFNLQLADGTAKLDVNVYVLTILN